MAFYVSVIFAIFLSFLYWLEKKDLKPFFLFWYIVFLPTQKLLPEDMVRIPGFRFEMFFGLMFLFFDLVVNQPKGFIPTKFIYSKIKHALIIFSLQLFFVIYLFLKDTLQGVSSEDDPNLLFFIVKHLITVIIFLRMAVYLQDDYYRKIIIIALAIGFTFLGISSFLSPFFRSLGVAIAGSSTRSAGLFKGHVTQFAGFMSTGFGFAFAFFIVNKVKLKRLFFLIVMMGCLIGVLNSAARAGIFGIVAIILFYILVEKQNFSTKAIIIFLVISIGIWILLTFGGYLIERFGTTEEQLAGDENESSRMAVWGAYLYMFANNPDIWLLGTWRYLNISGHILSSHSIIVKYLVFGGIPFFLFFYVTIFQLFRYYFRKKDILNFNILYPVIGYLIPSTMNDNIDFLYFPIILSLGLFNQNEFKLSLLLQKMKKRKSENLLISEKIE